MTASSLSAPTPRAALRGGLYEPGAAATLLRVAAPGLDSIHAASGSTEGTSA